MEIKEAIKIIIDACNIWEYLMDTGDDWTDVHKARDLVVSTLEKQGWRNARKDPPKRPDNMWDTYYVYTNSDRYGIARYYAHGKWDGYDEDGDRIEEDEIIAYCNFKPYMEGES